MTLAEALEELRDTVQADNIPPLNNETLRRILRRTTRVKNFAVGAAYQRGMFVAPASANLDTYQGAVYLVVTSGVSAEEPAWASPSKAFSSGGTHFSYFGPCEVYDLHEATREGWKAKMGAATLMIHSKEGGVDQEWQQVFDQCERCWRACGPAVAVG